jgi:Ca-activated chloride channel family protein
MRVSAMNRSVAWAIGVMVALAGCGNDDGGAGEDNGLEAPGANRGDDDESTIAGGAGSSGGNTTGSQGPGFGSALPPSVIGSGGAGGGSAAAFDPASDADDPGGANTNVSLGGAQDFGYYRSQLAAGIIPALGDYDAAGFFAEHHTALPEPDCGERVCLQAMLGVLGNLMNGQNCTMLQLGLNSPIAADASERPPLNLAVVVDVSGSMNTGGKIDFVREGLGLLVDGLRDTDQVAIVTYSDGAEVLFPLQEVSLQRAQLRTIVQGLVADGSTNLYGGLELGYQELVSGYDSGRQNRMILLSDGVPTAGITGVESIMDMSRGYNSDGMGLTTVGLGTDFNGVLMRGLAEQGDGNTYFLENAGAVSEVFTEELSYFTVPVAFDLTLELTTGEHYELRRAHGSSFWKDTSAGGTLEVPSVFLAHRESDEDVTDAGGRRGGGSALMIELAPAAEEIDGVDDAVVANVEVSFREPGTNELVTDAIELHFPGAPWATPARGFFDSPDLSIIQKSFVMLNIYVAFEETSRLFYGNQGAEALELLEHVIDGVEDFNAEVQDVDIEYDLEMLHDLRDLVAAQGIVLPTDFVEQQDPWPAD